MKSTLVALALLGTAALAMCCLGLGWISTPAMQLTLVCTGGGLLCATSDRPSTVP